MKAFVEAMSERKSSLVEGHPNWVLLANYEGGLHEICTTMRAVLEAC